MPYQLILIMLLELLKKSQKHPTKPLESNAQAAGEDHTDEQEKH